MNALAYWVALKCCGKADTSFLPKAINFIIVHVALYSSQVPIIRVKECPSNSPTQGITQAQIIAHYGQSLSSGINPMVTSPRYRPAQGTR